MNRKERRAMISRLVKVMRDNNSWAGETHVQKCVYFLQNLLHTPIDYEFVLYKHGPYSFDLQSELAYMRARFQLGIEIRNPYGPSFTIEVRGKQFANRASEYDDAINFVGKELSARDVRSLERLSTVLFLQDQNPKLSDSQIACQVNKLKPHISVCSASVAVRKVSKLRKKAECIKKACAR